MKSRKYRKTVLCIKKTKQKTAVLGQTGNFLFNLTTIDFAMSDVVKACKINNQERSMLKSEWMTKKTLICASGVGDVQIDETKITVLSVNIPVFETKIWMIWKCTKTFDFYPHLKRQPPCDYQPRWHVFSVLHWWFLFSLSWTELELTEINFGLVFWGRKHRYHEYVIPALWNKLSCRVVLLWLPGQISVSRRRGNLQHKGTQTLRQDARKDTARAKPELRRKCVSIANPNIRLPKIVNRWQI